MNKTWNSGDARRSCFWWGVGLFGWPPLALAVVLGVSRNGMALVLAALAVPAIVSVLVGAVCFLMWATKEED